MKGDEFVTRARFLVKKVKVDCKLNVVGSEFAFIMGGKMIAGFLGDEEQCDGLIKHLTGLVASEKPKIRVDKPRRRRREK